MGCGWNESRNQPLGLVFALGDLMAPRTGAPTWALRMCWKTLCGGLVPNIPHYIKRVSDGGSQARLEEHHKLHPQCGTHCLVCLGSWIHLAGPWHSLLPYPGETFSAYCPATPHPRDVSCHLQPPEHGMDLLMPWPSASVIYALGRRPVTESTAWP